MSFQAEECARQSYYSSRHDFKPVMMQQRRYRLYEMTDRHGYASIAGQAMT